MSLEYGFSPVCVRLWLCKVDFREKEESHISHEYGFSPVCVHLCLFKVDLSEKEKSHISQEYGFSPVCVRLCLFKEDFWIFDFTLNTLKWHQYNLCQLEFVITAIKWLKWGIISVNDAPMKICNSVIPCFIYIYIYIYILILQRKYNS